MAPTSKKNEYTAVAIGGTNDGGNDSSLYSQVKPRVEEEGTAFVSRHRFIVLGMVAIMLMLVLLGLGLLDDDSGSSIDGVDLYDDDFGEESNTESMEKQVNVEGKQDADEADQEAALLYPTLSTTKDEDGSFSSPLSSSLSNSAPEHLSRHNDNNIPTWLAEANAKARTPSKLTAVDHPDDPCYNMRKAWEDMPYDFSQSDRDVIIGAGEGATGTTYASNLVRKLGYKTAHWNHANADSKTLKEWKHVLAKLLGLQPLAREHFNFDVIPKKIDGIFDTPVANLFPYLFKAYPKAKVILTTRTPAQWVVSRTRRSYLQSYPSTYQRASILEEMKNPAAVTTRSRPQATMLQYEMFNLMVRCIVPKDQLLELDVIETRDDQVIEAFDKFIGLKSAKKKG